MIKTSRKLLGALLGFALMSAAQANGLASGTVVYFVPFVYNNHEGFVVRLTTMSTPAACSTSNRFIMMDTDMKYKTTLAAVMGAALAGSFIRIHGTGACTMYDNASEDLAYACLGSDPC